MRRPNILFLIADDHRGTGDAAETPTLDSLAARGVTYRRAYTIGGMSPAVCIPSRAALHTGVNVSRATPKASYSNYAGCSELDPQFPTLGETFRRAGYRTHAVGKWHNDRAAFHRSFSSGSEIFFGSMTDQWHANLHDYDLTTSHTATKHTTETFCDAGVEFLRHCDEPFFLYVAFTSPHDPRTAPAAFHARYDSAKIALPPNFMPEHPFDNGELRIRDEMLAPFPRSPEVVRQHLADYYAMITHIDAEIGRLVAAVPEDTIIVYTSDHGLAVGQHGLMGKQNMYEHSVRIPMIMSGPGVPRGEQRDGLRYLYDLYPLLCELCDVPIPATVEATTQPRDYVRSFYADIQRMVTDGRWKLIEYRRSVERHVGVDRIQLFNLQNDPWEMRELAGRADVAEIETRLMKQLC